MALISHSSLVDREGLDYRMSVESIKMDKSVTMSREVSDVTDI